MQIPRVLAGVALLLVLGGCVASDDSLRDEIHDLKKTDAPRIVEARTMMGNWTFLAWVGGPNEPMYVPGLTKEEMHDFIESRRFGVEPYYLYNLGSGDTSRDHKALRAAKLDYTERFNRALAAIIHRREGK